MAGPETDTTEIEYDVTTDLVDDTVVPAGGDGGATVAPDGTTLETHVQPKTDKPLTLRDQLSNAFKGGDDNVTDTGEKDSGKPAVDAPSNVNTPALTQDAEGRWRKVDGTFASTEEIQAMQSANTEQKVKLDEFIGTLPSNVSEQIKSLPAETQQFVVSTMEDLNNRAQRYSEYDQLEQLIGPRRQAWAEQGANPVVALNQLFALSDYAGRDPEQFVLWFAEQHGIDLDAALDARDANGQVSPEVQQLRGQVQQLSQTLTQLQRGGGQVQPDANVQAVQNFATEQDEGGNLKRPYLSEVMPTFAAHVSAVRTSNPTMPNDQVLAKAYEAACWADPNVRAKMQAEVDNQRREAARQKVEAKRAAASSVRGAPNGGAGLMPGTSHGNRSLREELQAQFAAHGS